MQIFGVHIKMQLTVACSGFRFRVICFSLGCHLSIRLFVLVSMVKFALKIFALPPPPRFVN
jgi:hypothetical protein